MRPAVPAGEPTCDWRIVEVDCMANEKLFVAIPGQDDMPDLDEPEFDGFEWLGPISPDNSDLLQLLKAGSVLAKVASDVYLSINGARNSPLQSRLDGAIDGWIAAVGAKSRSRSDA